MQEYLERRVGQRGSDSRPVAGPSPTFSQRYQRLFLFNFSSSSGGLQPGGFGALTCGIAARPSSYSSARKECASPESVCTAAAFSRVGQRLGESAVQKQHAPEKQACAVMVWLPLEDYEQVLGCFFRPSSAGINEAKE